MRNATDRTAADTAVVIGASMAGLCAARVLVERVRRVLVLDRDSLPESPTWRKQVPQGRHPHLLLASGARQVERWFPGLIEELYEGGAVELDISADVLWHQSGAPLRRPPSAVRGPSMSRPFLEWTLRRRLAADPRIAIRDETAANGLKLDATGDRVASVRLADGGEVPCDLLVDATGRRAHTVGWLEDEGYPSPEVSRVDIDTRYVSQELRRTEQPARDWKLAGLIGDPDTKRLAIALPIEDERWLVVFGGVHGEVAPVDDAERRAYARTLPSSEIADVLDASEPLGAPVTYRFRSSQRRHVERLARFPLGWVPIGDALASFNPIYGQGMTSAALQAAVLGDALDRTGAVDRAFARRYLRAASKVAASAWSTAVGGDFAYPDTTGPKPRGTDLLNRYTDRVITAAQRDDDVAVRFAEVVAMIRRPESLLAPPTLLRVLRASRRGSVAGVTA